MQKITQQRVSRALGYLVAAIIVIPAQLLGSPANAATGAPGVIPNVRYDGNGAKSVSISWDAPRTDGSFPVSDYVIEYRPAGGSWTVFDDGVSTERSARVTGLEAGLEYEFRVAAANLAGLGPASQLGIGTNPIVSSSGLCATGKLQTLACHNSGVAVPRGATIQDPNEILAPETVRDIVDFAGWFNGRNQDLYCSVSRSRGVICSSSFNEQGQLGQGYVGQPFGSFVVPGLPDDVIDVSTVRNTACALTRSGEVWCWGQWSANRFGRHLLNPTLQFRGAKDIAGNCAIQWDNTVTCLSIDTEPFRWVSNAAFPTALSIESDEGYNLCAITTAHTIACTSKLNVSFSAVVGLSDVVELDYHQLHWCALIADGTVTCYGNNDYGQLGDGTYASGRTTARVPEPVAHLVISDEAGGWIKRSCAIGISATMYCWGDGVPGFGSSTIPRVVSGFGAWTAHAATAPSQVTGLTQTSRTARTVTVGWSAPESGDMALDGYELEWRVDGGAWTTVALTAGQRSWTIGGLPFVSYPEIRVSAVSAAGRGTPSATFTAATAMPPLRPAKPRVISSTNSSVTVSWMPASSPDEPVQSYTIEWTTDQVNWNSRTVSASETQTTISGLTAGSAIDVRIRSTNAAGISAPSDVVTGFTSGLTSHTIAVVDGGRQPVYGGQVTWAKADGSYESALDYGLTVDGRATFPYIPAGEVEVSLSDVQLLSGSIVDFDTVANIGYSSDSVITLPNEPSNPSHTVRVLLPNGLPVVGATVYVSGLDDTKTVNGATFHSPPVIDEGVTNEFGEVYVSGYSDAATQVFVEYNDGILIQRWDGLLGVADKVVKFNEMPWVDVPNPPTETNEGSLVSLTVRVGGTSGAASFATTRTKAAATVSVAPPAGASQKCKGKKLTSTIDATGTATLKVCASKSGRYVIQGKGVISTGAVALKVKGAAPLVVTTARAVSPSHTKVRVSWNPPTYSGGSTVTKYTVKLSKGKKTYTQVVTGTSAEFAGLSGATTWTVTITATSKSGTSEPVRLLVPVS